MKCLPSRQRGYSARHLTCDAMDAPVTRNADHVEHRQRLRTRFLKSTGDGMPDYELLEMVLFAAIPRGDVKPLAKRLLKRFGSFTDTIASPPDILLEVEGNFWCLSLPR